MATDYGKRLRQARKHAKLTQVQLSEKTGIPQSTISTAEREGSGSGETPVYAKACGVDSLWLGTGEGSMIGAVDELSQQDPAAATLAQAIRSLAIHLDSLDADARKKAGSLLAILADSPQSHAHIAALLDDVVRTAQPVEVEGAKKFQYAKQLKVDPWSPIGQDRRKQERREE